MGPLLVSQKVPKLSVIVVIAFIPRPVSLELMAEPLHLVIDHRKIQEITCWEKMLNRNGALFLIVPAVIICIVIASTKFELRFSGIPAEIGGFLVVFMANFISGFTACFFMSSNQGSFKANPAFFASIRGAVFVIIL